MRKQTLPGKGKRKTDVKAHIFINTSYRSARIAANRLRGKNRHDHAGNDYTGRADHDDPADQYQYPHTDLNPDDNTYGNTAGG